MTQHASRFTRLFPRVALTLILSLSMAGGAHAIGLGLYHATGSAKVGVDGGNDIDVTHGNFGFALDTNVAKRSLFNYRLGLESGEVEYGSVSFNESAMNHDFGFGIVRTRAMRLWAGPRLRIAVQDEGDHSAFGIGVGLNLGLNVHLGDHFSLFANAVHQEMQYSRSTSGVGYSSWENDVDSEQTTQFINVGVMLRIRDTY